ncbi:MAG: hypothetical protein WC551_10700 [Patescibacteria group bacterium]|jgi:hypothetical protein
MKRPYEFKGAGACTVEQKGEFPTHGNAFDKFLIDLDSIHEITPYGDQQTIINGKITVAMEYESVKKLVIGDEQISDIVRRM